MTFDHKIDVTCKVACPFSTRWIDEFVGLKCAQDILPLFPNAKEITESMAVFGALRKFKPEWPTLLGDHNVICLVPGDGHHPRTGAIAAYRSRWQVHSIDPLLRDPPRISSDRLTLHRRKVEDVLIPGHYDTCVILSTHSHATLDNTLKVLWANKYLVVALQCCVPMVISAIAHQNLHPSTSAFREYRDIGVFSPENTIKIWRIER